MAYSRKIRKADIRSVQFKTEKTEGTKEAKAASKVSAETLIQHNPARELRRIAWVATPLMIILVVATYFDTTHHWVIKLATWLLKLGA